MKIIADLHLHSKYSRAVSSQMEPQTMALWAGKKGIDLLATGDWTHPLWLKELESQLEEVGEGIYKLKSEDQRLASSVQFILSTEISSIYSQGGKGRRIHNLVMAPCFKTVYKINDELKRRGCNLMSDGRPIIGLSSIQLAELVWSIDESCLIIPAHVWTPWFSMFGSKSGFDSMKECWGKYADRIYAIETGLSSDPAMNWRIKDFDNRTIVSFGDAHSPAKLGREATVLELGELNFSNIVDSLRSTSKHAEVGHERFSSHSAQGEKSNAKQNSQRRPSGKRDIENFVISPRVNKIAYTVEFYPEEGKYHYSGHRNCKVRQSPEETKKKGAICPVCGRPLTLGVMHRVQQLAGREIKKQKSKIKNGLKYYYNSEDKKRPPYIMLVPLMEILAESFSIGVQSQKAKNEYENLIKNLGSEIDILTKIKLGEIESLAGARLAEGIKKARLGDIIVEPGFDGVFGTVKIWKDEEKQSEDGAIKSEQASLF